MKHNLSTLREYGDVWRGGLGLGVQMLKRSPRLAIQRLLLPVSYWRLAEFAYVTRQLPRRDGLRLLDVGSPKELAFILARRHAWTIHATDILPSEVDRSARYAAALALERNAPGTVISEVQDGRCLSYPDNFFDAAFSVSVIEHIPATGDTAAIRELVRVVRPGGRIIVTTPFDTTYRETFVDRDVYERTQVGASAVFFERHYDDASFDTRLLGPSGANLLEREIWGEGRLRMEHLMARSGAMRTLFSPLEPMLSTACLHRLGEREGHPMAIFFTLEVPV